jgi:hypothetical protein
MESRIAEIERLMQDPTLPHSDQQLLDQELDDLLRRMDAVDEFRAMGDFAEPDEERGCPCCTNERCEDCGQSGHMNRGPVVNRHTRLLCDVCIAVYPKCTDCGVVGADHGGVRNCTWVMLCEVCFANAEEDMREGCGNCAGCAYCMSFDGYDGADEV